MFIELFFFLFLFSCYFCSVDDCVVWITSGHCNQSSSKLFYEGWIIASMHQCYLQCRQVLFLLLFLAHTVSLYLWNVRLYASSWVFLFTGPFVEFLLLFTLRIVLSILQEEQLKFLSLWWDFYVVWFWEVFLFSLGFLF